MKIKYCIGFFSAMVCCTLLLTALYDYSYYKTIKKLNEQTYAITETQGQAQKNQGYYLKNCNGYVIVYLSDNETIYEYTSIAIDTLPESLQNEINTGKYLTTQEELYGFLQNYTS